MILGQSGMNSGRAGMHEQDGPGKMLNVKTRSLHKSASQAAINIQVMTL